MRDATQRRRRLSAKPPDNTIVKHMSKPHRNTSKSFFPTNAGIWLVIAFVILAGGLIYSQCLRKKDKQKDLEQQSLTNINGADASQLIHTVIPPSLASQIKEYTGFTVNFNSDNHTPNYVGWELLAEELDGEISRSNNFWYDADIDGCPDIPDYKRSGYDRGHLYPAADAKWDPQSMADCFSFANMTPQCHSLNSGAWKTLEDKERIWAKRDNRLIIIAGPVYTPSDTKRIGKIGVRVPSGFFKVMLAPDVENPRAIAFIYPNDIAPGNMQNYSMSVDEAETITGFDFFSALPDSIENIIESRSSFKEWNMR